MAASYPTFQDVKLYLGINNENNDALIVKKLKQSIATFENMTARKFVPTTETRKYNADGDEVISPQHLFIRTGDLISIDSLKIDGETVPSSNYYFNDQPPHFSIHLKKSSIFSFRTFSSDPEQSIEVAGKWGYMDEVPEDVFGVIIRLAAWLYQQKDNAMELDRPVAMSNAMILPAALPSDVEAVALFYRSLT